MAIEKINSVQPSINNVVENEVKQEELQSTPQSKGSSNDVIAVLASLAAIGAAGVAIYKHKSAKQAIEKAEQEAKKKIEAAEEKAKKAADEVEKKIQEAVDKAKKEFEEANGKTKKPDTDVPKTPSDSPKPSSDKTPKPVTSAPTSPTSVSAPASGEKKPSLFGRFMGIFKSKPKSAKPKAPKSTPETTTIFRPVTPRKPKAVPSSITTAAPTPAGVTAEDKPSITDRVKKFFSRKDKKPKRHSDDTEPKVPETQTTAPTSAATSTAAPAAVEAPIPVSGPKPVLTGSPAPEPIVEPLAAPKPIAEPLEAEEEEILDIAFEEKPSVWAKLKNIFTKGGNRVPKNLEGGVLDTQMSAVDENYLQRLQEGQNGIIFVPNKPPKFIQKLMDLFKKKEESLEPFIVEAPIIKPAEEFLVKLPDFTKFSEEALVGEYNSLNKVVQGLPVLDPTAQRFLAIKGELFNHRGYKIQNGELVKVVPEPKLSEVFKGINMPDVTTISEQNLLMEYNALKGIVKDLPVADPTAQRFLAIKGELFNHRGYRFENGELVKIEPKVEKTPEIAKYVADKEAELNGRIAVNVPKKPTNYEHKQLQKEYEEALGINAKKKSPYVKPEITVKPQEQKPVVSKAEPKIESKAEKVKADVKPPVQNVVSLVDRSMPEFKGLTEEEALQLEYANCKYCVEDLFSFMDLKQAPYKARMVEIEAELQKLGKEVNASVFEDEVMKTRLQTVNQRVVVADDIKFLVNRKEEFAEATTKLNEAGIDGVTQTPQEMYLQGKYVYNKRMGDSYSGYDDDVKSVIARLEEKGFKPFEVVTEQDKVIANYMEAYYFKILSESSLNRSEKELAYLEEQLSKVLSKEGSKKK